jgi:hypothetical protein
MKKFLIVGAAVLLLGGYVFADEKTEDKNLHDPTGLFQEEAKIIDAEQIDGKKVRTLHFVQDDAQDYMVSKIYILKYVQSNDIYPFVTAMVKRYNMNSVVNCIEYGNDNLQFLTVSCPVKMMPYVDEFIKMVDINIEIDGKVPGDIIKGTGITRAVYTPKYRSGQILVDLIVNSFVNNGPYSSLYGYDANSNQIYWKDNTTNTEFIYQFLGFLDRPAPQINLVFKLYTVRDSELRDLGIDYLAWKNGPGLNIFQAGYQAFDISRAGELAMTAASGGFGGFFFAPQFDASFIRILQQSGHAKLENTASMTVSNSDTNSYNISFNPQFQNIIKTNNDITSVSTSSVAGTGIPQLSLVINQPIVNLHEGSEIEFEIANYTPGHYAKIPSGTVFFGYNLTSVNSVERNNYGSELLDTNNLSGNLTMELNQEKIVASWEKLQEVEQVIGVPFLSEIPILKYLFSTTTTSEEKVKVYLTVKAEMLDTDKSFNPVKAGVLTKLR